MRFLGTLLVGIVLSSLFAPLVWAQNGCAVPGITGFEQSQAPNGDYDLFTFTGCVPNSSYDDFVISFFDASNIMLQENIEFTPSIGPDGSFRVELDASFPEGTTMNYQLIVDGQQIGSLGSVYVDYTFVEAEVVNPACSETQECTTADGQPGSMECSGEQINGACELQSCGTCISVADPVQEEDVREAMPVTVPENDGEPDISQQDPDADIIDFSYCLQVPDGTQRSNCEQCISQGEDGEYVYTAVGCVRTAGAGLTRDLVRLMMGAVGGVAIMSILAGAFFLSISRGDSSKVKEAKELITAAVSGLFFIIFSIFILQFVGVSILQIPGLGGSGGQGAVRPVFDDPNIQGGGQIGGGNPAEPVAENPPAVPAEPQDTEWQPEDVQWSTSVADDGFVEVCITYPQAGVADNTIGVRATPSVSGSSYPVFEWSLGAAQKVAGERYRQCGSVNIESYAAEVVENIYENQFGSSQSFQGGVIDGGQFSYSVGVSQVGAADPNVSAAEREAFLNALQSQNALLRVEYAVNGQTYTDFSIPFVGIGG